MQLHDCTKIRRVVYGLSLITACMQLFGTTFGIDHMPSHLPCFSFLLVNLDLLYLLNQKFNLYFVCIFMSLVSKALKQAPFEYVLINSKT